jgi:hypothetical protein
MCFHWTCEPGRPAGACLTPVLGVVGQGFCVGARSSRVLVGCEKLWLGFWDRLEMLPRTAFVHRCIAPYLQLWQSFVEGMEL